MALRGELYQRGLKASIQPYGDLLLFGRVEFEQVPWSGSERMRNGLKTGARVSLLAGLDSRYCPDRQTGPGCKRLHLHAAELPPLTDMH